MKHPEPRAGKEQRMCCPASAPAVCGTYEKVVDFTSFEGKIQSDRAGQASGAIGGLLCGTPGKQLAGKARGGPHHPGGLDRAFEAIGPAAHGPAGIVGDEKMTALPAVGEDTRSRCRLPGREKGVVLGLVLVHAHAFSSPWPSSLHPCRRDALVAGAFCEYTNIPLSDPARKVPPTALRGVHPQGIFSSLPCPINIP